MIQEKGIRRIKLLKKKTSLLKKFHISERIQKLFIIFASSIALMIIVIIILSLFRDKSCADKTLYGKCSDLKPYYCGEKIIENASYCGCDNLTAIENNACISKYQQEPKNIFLNYILKGDEEKINFTVYKNLSDYLFSIPISMDYQGQQIPRAVFKLKDLNNEEQKELLYPLVVKIQNLAKDETEQARIAISVVQNIKYGSSNETINFGDGTLIYSRYPYQVLYDSKGICGEKSELLAYLLRELGYGVVIFYFPFENHEAVGIKCPLVNSYRGTGYCFVETTGPSIITDGGIQYFGIGKLYSTPQVIFISYGNSLPSDLYEYSDALELKSLRDSSSNNGGLNPFQVWKYNKLKEKYGLQTIYNAG